MMCRFPRFGPVLFAHRGYHLESPENSLAAFRRALDVGADVLEMDVRMSADGQLVVVHDADGRRVAGDRRTVTTLSYDELRRWDLRHSQTSCSSDFAPVRVPRFAEVLAAFPGVALNVDIKQVRPAIVEPLIRIIMDQGAAERVLLTSFSSTNLRRVHTAQYPGPIGVSQLGVVRALFAPNRLLAWGRRPLERLLGEVAPQEHALCRRLQIPLAFQGIRLDTREVIERAHRQGYLVDYWVVNDSSTAQRLLDLGADGIVTDDVPRMAQVFATHVRTESYRLRRGLASANAASISGSFK